MRRHRFLVTAGAAGAAFGMPLRGLAETLLRASYPTAASQPTVAECVRFGRLAEQKSNGALKFENYFSGTLAKEGDVITGLQSGVVDLTLLNSSFLETQFPRFQALSLPFMFPTRAAMWRVLDGEIGRGFESDLSAKGITALAWGAYGSREFELRDKRVTKPEDLVGLKIRIINSAVYVSMMKALGAIPVVLDVTEQLLALEQHTIDGLEITVPTLLSQNLDKVVKYIARTEHNMNSSPLLMSKRRLDGLPADQRKAITDAAREFVPTWHQTIETSDEAALAEFVKRGGTVNQVDKAAFRRAMAPVYAEFRQKLGSAYIDRIIALAS